MSLEAIYEAILNGKHKATAEAVQAALDDNVPAEDILNKACIPAMDEVGRLFERNEKFVPEMLISARAMETATGILKPLLIEQDVQARGKVVIGTVAGDLHDIGKNLVSMMMEGAGFEIIDLGVDVSPETFVEAVRDIKPQIIGMSTLLTTTMAAVTGVIEALKEAGLRDQVKILVGGAPVTQDFVEKVGADGFAPDAAGAARIAKALMGAV